MPKHRALIRMSISVTSFRRGPIRIDDHDQAKLDLECLKENHPDFREGTIAGTSNPFFDGETDEIFTDGTCD